MLAEELEKPLPKPKRDLADYASARTLEALLEGLLALKFLERGSPGTLLARSSRHGGLLRAHC